MMRIDASLRPVGVAVLGVAILTGQDAAMKIVAAAYPLGEVVFLRHAMSAVFAFAAFRLARQRPIPRSAIGRNMTRAGVVVLTGACFFTALARLPLAEAIALTFLSPLFISLLGRWMLKEPVGPWTLAGVAIGFCGVLVIALGREGGGVNSYDMIGVSAAVLCAFCYALSNVLTRRQSGVDSVFSIVLLSNVFAAIYVSPLMLLTMQTPSWRHLAAFAAAGLLGATGHLCIAWAYSHAPAGRLGTTEYTAFIWAIALGFLIFAEIPTVSTLVGAGVIILACLFAGWTPEASRLQPDRDILDP